MSVSKVSICNLALNHLSANTINSLSEDSPSAVACNSFYDDSLNDVFSEFQWPFATVRETLVLSSAEVLGWDYVYQYPVKAAAVWSVFDEATVDKKHEQEFETFFIPSQNIRVIGSNLASAYAEYTYKVSDPTIYNAKFVIAFSYRLASAMAFSLTGSEKTGIDLLSVYNAILAEAKRMAYSERLKKPTQTSGYVTSRG